MDVREIDKKFKSNSISFILASHLLEHMKYDEALNTVKKCHKILKKGGKMTVEVPNGSFLALPLKEEDSRFIRVGMPEIPYFKHEIIFTMLSLYELLKEGGFKKLTENCRVSTGCSARIDVEK
jgi:predicted SAM-dependent methyltransferase